MTGTTRSSEGLDLRRRKLLFRSWHRGMREMDLIMGGFADARVEHLSEPELAEFERLIDVPDRDLLAWITGEESGAAGFRQRLVSRSARLPPHPRRRGLRHGAVSRRSPGARAPADAWRASPTARRG